MKTCNHPGCSNKVWSHNFCQWHQKDRTDVKYLDKMAKSGEIRGYVIPKVSDARRRLIADQGGADKAFYAHIWEHCKRSCSVCGKFLGHEPFTTFFHHILVKAKFPKLRYVEENIVVLCPDCHNEAHQSKGKPDWYKQLTAEKTLEFTKKGLL